MANNYISAPNNFVHMEGNSVDFRKTFNLNGTNNDEMLRLYLRKAGLTDEIDSLSPEQRRAFIYDIIKSNKMPGYWMPSTMKTSAFAMPPPSVRPPPPPANRMGIPSPFAERRSGNATISASSSSSSLQSMGSGCGSNIAGAAAVVPDSPIVMHRFMAASTTTQPPTSVLTSGKGTRYEISGPIHFEHVSGDMTRDMTRNAFELAPRMNDNVLKKYLIERGITGDDISGMRKQDLICKIVQSQFTWKPPKRNSTVPPHVNTTQPKIVYATISNNNERSPSLAPQPSTPSSQPLLVASNEPVSNFALVTSRFVDPSEFPSPNALFNNEPQQSVAVAAPSPQSPIIKMPPRGRSPRPAPPPRKPKDSQEFLYEGPIPPPPSNVTAVPNEPLYASIQHARADNQGSWTSIPTTTPDAIYAQPKKKKELTTLQPPPPPTAMKTGGGIPVPPPPPPPPPTMMTSSNGAPPPPPPLMMVNNGASPPPQLVSQQRAPAASNAAVANGDPRDAFLESIRKGVALKKSDHTAATISGIKPRQEEQPPVKDFLSELKMGITLRRVKHVDGDDDEPDESQA